MFVVPQFCRNYRAAKRRYDMWATAIAERMLLEARCCVFRTASERAQIVKPNGKGNHGKRGHLRRRKSGRRKGGHPAPFWASWLVWEMTCCNTSSTTPRTHTSGAMKGNNCPFDLWRGELVNGRWVQVLLWFPSGERMLSLVNIFYSVFKWFSLTNFDALTSGHKVLTFGSCFECKSDRQTWNRKKSERSACWSFGFEKMSSLPLVFLLLSSDFGSRFCGCGTIIMSKQIPRACRVRTVVLGGFSGDPTFGEKTEPIVHTFQKNWKVQNWITDIWNSSWTGKQKMMRTIAYTSIERRAHFFQLA